MDRARFQTLALNQLVGAFVESGKQIGALENHDGRWDKGGSDQGLVDETTAVNNLLSPDTEEIQADDTNGDL